MHRKFFMLSVLAALICFSNHNVFASDEKVHQAAELDQSQASFEDLPGDLRSLIKKTFYADALSSYDMIRNGKEFKVVNKLQNLEATFTNEGVCIKGTRAENLWKLELCLNGFGWVDSVKPVKAGALVSDKNRVEIDRGSVREWFINDRRGLEQGFTIDHPPVGTGTQLVLELLIHSDWEALISQDKRNITLTNNLGQSVDYSGLIAEDAHGLDLNTWFAARNEEGRLICEIMVDVVNAQFPIIVDPIINEDQKIQANDEEKGDAFSMAVDVSNDTVIVGAPFDDDNGGNSGSAYIFVRTGTTWTQQAKLLANDGSSNDSFGSAVSLSGETAVVGAFGSGPSGAAYIFVRTGTNWSQQAKLLASDGDFFDRFGESVNISGETAIIGASRNEDNGFASGSAYIFVRSGTTWAEQAKLLANDGAMGDLFGSAVGLSGETAVVGAFGKGISGSAYIFVRTGTTWAQQAKLQDNNGTPAEQFGFSVSISGETVVVGALNDDDNGPGSGSALIFVRTGTTWTQQAKLLADDGDLGDSFGFAVDISGEMVVVGARLDDNGGSGSGSAYIFVRTGTIWSQQVKLLPSDGMANEIFGRSVGISGETAVAGAFDDSAIFNMAIRPGLAYAFDVFCQKDLGFQLGNLRLSICGQDLTKANSTATLCVSGAAPNAQIFLALGPTNNPMPLLSGFLVPFPFTALGPFPADASGNFTLPLPGGSNSPFIFFLQAAAFNGPVFELSNALEVNIGS